MPFIGKKARERLATQYFYLYNAGKRGWCQTGSKWCVKWLLPWNNRIHDKKQFGDRENYVLADRTNWPGDHSWFLYDQLKLNNPFSCLIVEWPTCFIFPIKGIEGCWSKHLEKLKETVKKFQFAIRILQFSLKFGNKWQCPNMENFIAPNYRSHVTWNDCKWNQD